MDAQESEVIAQIHQRSLAQEVALAGPVRQGEYVYRKPGHVGHVLDGERAVLMHLGTGAAIALSPEATRIWQLVLVHGTAAAVVEELSGEFDVDRVTLAEDVLRTLDELVSAGLLELAA